MDGENLDMEKFTSIGIVKKAAEYKEEDLEYFTATIRAMRDKGSWTRGELVELFNRMLPEFHHKETGKFLDSRM